jgi:hypothetical protein
MSLSLIVKLVIFAGLALLAAAGGRGYGFQLASYLTDVHEITARDAHISRRSIAYRIPQDGKLTFVFSQPVTKAKVLVHPSTSKEVRGLEDGFIYGVRARWIGAAGEELSVYEAYLQADSPDVVFASGEVWRFFRTRPELVAEQDQLLIESDVPAAQLELEVFALDTGIVGVDVRVFEQRKYLGNQSLAAYRRLSDETRGRLTQPNVFPADMLSDEERLALGRYHWRSVGPLGGVGRDYTMLILYEAMHEDLIADGRAQRGVLP